MVADDKSLSIGGQTRQSLEKIDAMLKELGSDAAHLLHVAIYVTDIADRDELNAAWMKFFDSEMLPTRALVGVKELGPGTLVELVATAAVFNHAE
jgi:enamine deaminase RidA (YjgF/YER057c/UK114 family)